MDFEEKLKNYKEVIDKELEIFLNKKIRDIPNFPKELYSFTTDYVLTGGKRLRPIIMLEAYKAVGGKEYITKQALSVELFHNSTLIHDDFMDEDELRRGKPTVYRRIKDYFLENYKEINYDGSLFNKLSSRFSVTNATLLGNILFTFGLSCLNNSEAIKVYNNAYKIVNEGQILDVFFENKNITEADYFNMIERKTAHLFIASIEIGALLENAKQEQINYLKEYARNIAVAFQLYDDLMDINEEASKGHELGSDIKQGKKTLLVIKTVEKCNPEEKKFLLNILDKKDSSEEDIKKAIEIIKGSGAIDYTNNIINKKITEAKIYLKKANIKKENYDFFNNLADYVIKRDT